MSHLIIDTDRCIGCGRCVKVCIRANISVMDGKAKETPSGPMGCFDCGHCMAVCPKDAIRLEKYMDQNDRIVDHDDSKVIGYDTMMEFLRRRRSIRWFKDEKVPDDVLQKLFDASYYSPSAQNSQKVEFVVMDQRLDEFQSHIAKILEPLRDEYPRIGQKIWEGIDPSQPGDTKLTSCVLPWPPRVPKDCSGSGRASGLNMFRS